MTDVKGSTKPVLSRRERAAATQQRMVKAAYSLFCERGYAGTTMAEVATAAGVAVQTVYFTFHTKLALLSRAYDFAVMGEGEPLSPWDQPWYLRMSKEPNVVEALRHMMAGIGEITRRVTPLYVVLRASAVGDPEVAGFVSSHHSRRAEGFRAMLEILVTKARLRPGITAERANHLLLLYSGMDVYHVLVDTYRWTHAEWADWCVTTLADQLFAQIPRLQASGAARRGTSPLPATKPRRR